MATECSNKLTISGSVDLIAKIKAILILVGLDKDAGRLGAYLRSHGANLVIAIDRLTPCPFVTENVNTRLTRNNDWCWEHWGTEGVYPDCEELNDTGDSYSVGFYSIWSPPLLAFEKISLDYSEVLFEIQFFRNHSDFRGTCSYLNGEEVNYELYEPEENEEVCDHDGVLIVMDIERKVPAPCGSFFDDFMVD